MSDLALKIAKALHETEIGETCAAGDNQPCSWITEKVEIVDRVLSETQPYPHGARSPEPFWAAHIRKLESDYKVMEAKVERLRAALELVLASEQGAAKTIAAQALDVPLTLTTTVVLASTGTGAEVEG